MVGPAKLKIRYLRVASNQYHVWNAAMPSRHMELTLEELTDFAKIGWRLGIEMERIQQQRDKKLMPVKGHDWKKGQK